jgi:hypothetical protein
MPFRHLGGMDVVTVRMSRLMGAKPSVPTAVADPATMYCLSWTLGARREVSRGQRLIGARRGVYPLSQ